MMSIYVKRILSCPVYVICSRVCRFCGHGRRQLLRSERLQLFVMKTCSGSSQRDSQAKTQRPGDGSTGFSDCFKSSLAFIVAKRMLGGAGKTKSETAGGTNKSHSQEVIACNKLNEQHARKIQCLALSSSNPPPPTHLQIKIFSVL